MPCCIEWLNLPRPSSRKRTREIRVRRGGEGAVPVRLLCEVLGVTRSGYYAWVDRSVSRKTIAERELLLEIKAALVRWAVARTAARAFTASCELTAFGWARNASSA